MVIDYGRKTPLLQAKAGFMLILRWKRAFSHAHLALDNSLTGKPAQNFV